MEQGAGGRAAQFAIGVDGDFGVKLDHAGGQLAERAAPQRTQEKSGDGDGDRGRGEGAAQSGHLDGYLRIDAAAQRDGHAVRAGREVLGEVEVELPALRDWVGTEGIGDRKSTRLNSS